MIESLEIQKLIEEEEEEEAGRYKVAEEEGFLSFLLQYKQSAPLLSIGFRVGLGTSFCEAVSGGNTHVSVVITTLPKVIVESCHCVL